MRVIILKYISEKKKTLLSPNDDQKGKFSYTHRHYFYSRVIKNDDDDYFMGFNDACYTDAFELFSLYTWA